MSTRLSKQDLQPDTTYAIRIRAVGPTGVSEWSTRRVFTTITDQVLPSMPLNPTWVVSGDNFVGAWDTVVENEEGDTIPITRYEIELGNGATTKIVSVPPATGGGRVTYDLTYDSNRNLF